MTIGDVAMAVTIFKFHQGQLWALLAQLTTIINPNCPHIVKAFDQNGSWGWKVGTVPWVEFLLLRIFGAYFETFHFYCPSLGWSKTWKPHLSIGFNVLSIQFAGCFRGTERCPRYDEPSRDGCAAGRDRRTIGFQDSSPQDTFWLVEKMLTNVYHNFNLTTFILDPSWPICFVHFAISLPIFREISPPRLGPSRIL